MTKRGMTPQLANQGVSQRGREVMEQQERAGTLTVYVGMKGVKIIISSPILMVLSIHKLELPLLNNLHQLLKLLV